MNLERSNKVMHTGTRRASRAFRLTLLLVIVLGVTGNACRNGMRDDARIKPLETVDFFPDGRSGRAFVAGTVPRGVGRVSEQEEYLQTGLINGQPGNEMPFPLTREVLQRGRERFEIYCSPCHDRLGTGQGMIVQRGMARPPSYHIDRLRTAPLGHFVDVMTRGFGAMYPYAYRVAPQDRWAIAAYIRTLQLSQGTTVAHVPEDQLQKLEEMEE
ncbi:MAG TPA: cytochrome c [Acidobacteriota bacterium]|nr:cytochrome c [Acidobacteriota bacterium]